MVLQKYKHTPLTTKYPNIQFPYYRVGALRGPQLQQRKHRTIQDQLGTDVSNDQALAALSIIDDPELKDDDARKRKKSGKQEDEGGKYVQLFQNRKYNFK